MDALLGVIGTIAEDATAKTFKMVVETLKDDAVDKQIEKQISEDLLQKYGAETFYADLDRYITNNHIIENLIPTVRGQMHDVLPCNAKEFAEENAASFVAQYKSPQKSKIYSVFEWMFNFAFSKANTLNPHTDLGKLQNDLCRMDENMQYRDEKIYMAINNSIANFSKGQQKIESDTMVVTELLKNLISITGHSELDSTDFQMLANYPKEIEELKQDIKYIESEYQRKDKFELAILKYHELLQRIYRKITPQNKKYIDELICNLNCDLALCQTNLDHIDEAKRSLDAIPTATAENNKMYHFVCASIPLQYNDITEYDDAKEHLNRALELDPQYHIAFLLRQYLYALIGSEECDKNIEELNNHFSTVLKENSDENLISDFYINRGVIYLTYEKPFLAEKDFKKASELGHNGLVEKINLVASLYAQAVAELPKGKEIVYPKVDFSKIITVIKELKPIVTSENINTAAYGRVARSAVKIYVSACGILGIRHGLTPLDKYLSLSDDYEIKRMLILGSSNTVSKENQALLNDADLELLNYHKLLEDGNFNACKESLEKLIEAHPDKASAPFLYMLLQIFLMERDTESYKNYRDMAASLDVRGEVLWVLDGYAFEIDGDAERAKEQFDKIATLSNDYNVLEKTLLFFHRNNYKDECATLYLRVQELHENHETFIENIDEFYSKAIGFFVSIDSPSALEMLQKIDSKEVSENNYFRLQAFVYSKMNDIESLATCLSTKGPDTQDFQDKMNLAICQRALSNYDSALEICEKLLNEIKQPDHLEKLYWFISDLYLLKRNYGDSYLWAEKAHKNTEQNPYSQSHHFFLSRAFRCGRQEDGIAVIMEYKKIHPVVLDWVRAFQIETGKEQTGITEKINELYPDYEKQEKNIAYNYQTQLMPIQSLMKFFPNNLWRFFQFAAQNKLKIAQGSLAQQENEEKKVGHHIVVDAQTLLILSYFECLPALQSIESIHISYGSLYILQNHFLSENYAWLGDLLKWLESSENIIFHADGFLGEKEKLIEVLSKDFIVSCAISEKNHIPLLYSDMRAVVYASIAEMSLFQKIEFISIPVLCNYYGKNHQKAKEQMLYRLLTGCEFVSFGANTIIEQIACHDYSVSLEMMTPFLICKSDYDMESFSLVYLQAIEFLKQQHCEVAIELSDIIMDDTFKIWRRGEYYRMMIPQYDNREYQDKSTAIIKYVNRIASGIEKIFTDIPEQLKDKHEELKKIIL